MKAVMLDDDDDEDNRDNNDNEDKDNRDDLRLGAVSLQPRSSGRSENDR